MEGRGGQAEIWERNILGTGEDKCRDCRKNKTGTKEGLKKSRMAVCPEKKEERIRREEEGGGQRNRGTLSCDSTQRLYVKYKRYRATCVLKVRQEGGLRKMGQNQEKRRQMTWGFPHRHRALCGTVERSILKYNKIFFF